MAEGMKDGEEKVQVYRRVRDEIKAFVEKIKEYLLE